MQLKLTILAIFLFAININAQDLNEKEYSYLEDLYKHYHIHPELSFHEHETASRMAMELKSLGFEVTEKVGGTGIVGVLKNGEGPTVLVRADMDALPLVEETGVPHASKVTTVDAQGNTVGVMHACGHDMHMTVWTGTARQLVEKKDAWSGTVVFVGQPAEERGSGAREMIADGLYTRFPSPDYAIGLHVNANLPAGKVGYKAQYSMANVDMVDITVYGRGGHGAYPHTTIDPVLLAARIVTDLQMIVSREISPLEAAVVTVGSIHGGSKGNIIPNEVKLELTTRSYTDENRNGILEKIQRICNGVAISAGVPDDMFPTVFVRGEHCPALYNNEDLTLRLAEVFKTTIGEENVINVPAVMGGEDFSQYGRTDAKIPLMFYWLGAVEAEKYEKSQVGELNLPSLHSSKFSPDIEPTIRTGVKTMTAAVLDLLKK